MIFQEAYYPNTANIVFKPIMDQLFKIEVTFGTIVILCSLILSLKMFTKKRIPLYLKHFYLYPLLALMLSAFTVLNKFIFNFSYLTKSIVENGYILFELLFWGFFFLTLFKGQKINVLAKIIFLSALLLTVYLIFHIGLNSYNHKIISINNLAYTFFCCIYFFNLFKTSPTIKLKNDPVFFIILGIFFYSVFSLPLFSISDYFHKGSHTLFYIAIISIINFTIIVMHSFFIKGYLCLIQPSKV